MRGALQTLSFMVAVAILVLGGSVSAVADDGGGGGGSAVSNPANIFPNNSNTGVTFRLEVPVAISYDRSATPAPAVVKPTALASSTTVAECHCRHRHHGSCPVGHVVVQTARAVGGVATDTVGTTFVVAGDIVKLRLDCVLPDIGNSLQRTGRRFGHIFD